MSIISEAEACGNIKLTARNHGVGSHQIRYWKKHMVSFHYLMLNFCIMMLYYIYVFRHLLNSKALIPKLQLPVTVVARESWRIFLMLLKQSLITYDREVVPSQGALFHMSREG